MRFIHLADSHLSSTFSFNNSENNLIRETTWQSFENIFNTNKDVDFALIAGDLFDRNYFTSNEFDRLYDVFKSFDKDIYYVTGNHDYFDGYNTVFLNNKPNNLHIFTDDKLSVFERDGVRIYGISYKDRINSYKFPYDINLDNNYFNILLAHADISQNPTNYLDLDPLKLEKTGFSYIGLGHIHKPSHRRNSYYPGSIEPFNYNDLDEHGYILYEDGDIYRINSSMMRFYEIGIDADDYMTEEEIIDDINSQLEDKINFVRININQSNKDINNNIKDYIKAKSVELNIVKSFHIEDTIKLYPESLLSKYNDMLRDDEDEVSKLALKLGLDAILRTKR